jgi:hypothetical protein
MVGRKEGEGPFEIRKNPRFELDGRQCCSRVPDIEIDGPVFHLALLHNLPDGLGDIDTVSFPFGPELQDLSEHA